MENDLILTKSLTDSFIWRISQHLSYAGSTAPRWKLIPVHYYAFLSLPPLSIRFNGTDMDSDISQCLLDVLDKLVYP